MAININIALTTEAGTPILANSMMKPRLNFGADILERDEDGKYTGAYTRIMKADLFLYSSKAVYQADDTNVIGDIKEFLTNYTKVISDKDYEALMADGSLAEQWIIDYLNDILGAGICTLVDPYKK